MTKAELITYIATRPTFVAVNGDEVFQSERENGDKIYRRNVLKLKGTTSPDDVFAGYVNIYYIVRDEGVPGEEAYIMDMEPEDLT